MVNDREVFIRYSPNHNERPPVPVELLVLHYTGMEDGNSALERLCSAQSEVSAHYMVEEDGEVFLMVEEDRRAWHAGVSAWGAWENVNDVSIGVEIVNPGHEFGYRAFPQAQMDAVLALSKDIMRRHELPAHAVVGHSDIAPTRKQDPGELFAWQWLAQHGVGVWHDVAPYTQPPAELPLGAQDRERLLRLGYVCDDDGALVRAFQRRFRPASVTGAWDEECRACLTALEPAYVR